MVDHRDLTLAGLADSIIAAGGLPSTEPLLAAVADSGLPEDLVEPIAFIVDAVHGAASGVGSPGRHDDVAPLKAAFEIGIGTIVAGIAARAQVG